MNKKEVDNTSGGSNHSDISSKDDIAAKKIALDAIIKKIDYHLNKNSLSDVDLYYLIKDFFREYLNLKYEFSLDELISELDKIYLDTEQRERTLEFINKVKIIEYHDSSFSESRIKEFIVEFSAITKLLIKNTQYENKSFWDRFMTSFRKKKKKEDIDYYKHTHSNEQVDVPVPIPIGLSESEKNSLDSVTDNEFSSADEKFENSPSEELSKYRIESKNRKIKEDKQSKISGKENVAIPETYKNYEAPVYRKSYAPRDNENEERKSISDNNWDSEIDSMNRTSSETDDNSWTDPVGEEENISKKNDRDTGFDALVSGETDETEIDEEDDKKYNIDYIAKSIKKEKLKLDKKSGKDKIRENNKKHISRKNEKAQDSGKGKKLHYRKSSAKNQKKSENTGGSEIADLTFLIDKARKTKKKEELVAVYKKINSKYESSNIETQAKFYNSVMDIYKRISKIK